MCVAKPPLKPPVLRINHNPQTSRVLADVPLDRAVSCAGATKQGASDVDKEVSQGSSGVAKVDQGSSGLARAAESSIGLAKSSLEVPKADLVAADGQKHSSVVEAVPQVVDAIEQISNYFGSSGTTGQASATPTQQSRNDNPTSVPAVLGGGTTTLPPHQQGVKGDSSTESGSGSTAIGQLSREVIGRLAGAIAEQLTDAPDTPTEEHVDMPSYAPEKCIAEHGDGKGSHQELPTSAGVKSDKVSKLKDILVSEKDIFGGPVPLDESDSDEDVAGDMGGDKYGRSSGDVANVVDHGPGDTSGRGRGDVNIGDDGKDKDVGGSGAGGVCDSDVGGLLDEACDDVGEGGYEDPAEDEAMEHSTSSQPLTEAQMIAEFLKVTSTTSDDTVKESGRKG